MLDADKNPVSMSLGRKLPATVLECGILHSFICKKKYIYKNWSCLQTCHTDTVAAIFSILMEMRVFQFYFYFSASWELA
jgi:hypothetical protein